MKTGTLVSLFLLRLCAINHSFHHCNPFYVAQHHLDLHDKSRKAHEYVQKVALLDHLTPHDDHNFQMSSFLPTEANPVVVDDTAHVVEE